MNEIQVINRRNTVAVEQALGEMQTQLLNQQIRIDGLNASMSVMNERMSFLEKLVFEHKVKAMGTGASVK